MGSIAPEASLQRISASAGSKALLQAFQQNGAVVIKGFLDPEQLATLNREIDPELAKIEFGSNSKDADVAEFHGDKTKRCNRLPAISDIFVEHFLDRDLVHELCDSIFKKDTGDYWLSTAQIIEIAPGNKAQVLHRDSDSFPVMKSLGVNAPESLVNFFFALTDFTDENGGTRLIPGSHLWPDFNDVGRPEDTIPLEMKAGDVCLFSGKLAHGGGANRTENEYRRGIATAVQVSYLVPEEAYAFTLDRKRVQGFSPRVQKMVQWRSQWPRSTAGLWLANYSKLEDYLEWDK
jgi:ectoine hydroxylase-related dioxygenase (phytanoyl-CoA dioxygenase family)